MSLVSLPPETIRHILESLSLGHSDLAACCLVCHQLWEMAAPMLYKDLDFRSCEGIEIKEDVRQVNVIYAIALNPRLGAFVHCFHNELELWNSTYRTDSTHVGDEAQVNAAKNMVSLQCATLKSSPLTESIVRSLNAYHQLSELSLHAVDPLVDVWPVEMTALRKLSWVLPRTASDEDESWSVKRAALVLKVAQLTCPLLRSLHLRFGSDEADDPSKVLDYSAPYTSDGHDLALIPVMQHLRDFAIRGESRGPYDGKVQCLLENFLRDCGNSLVSLFISPAWMSEDTDIFASRCRSLPNLEKLQVYERTSTAGHDKQFVPRLLEKIISSGTAVDSFTLFDIQCPFSVDIGRIFGSWTGLKYLRLGDKDNSEGLFGDDGRIDFASYKSEILAFIKELPSSLEHLCLTINGDNLMMEDDEDFNPICEIGLPAFRHLRRLHSLDILAWISNLDGGLGALPEAAVHFRRLPYDERPTLQTNAPSQAVDLVNPEDATKVKTLWRSRFQCVYQEDIPDVTHDATTLALSDDDGVFEGNDASEIWWDRTPDACYARNERTRAKNDSSSGFWQLEPENIWPTKRETWNDYPLYQFV